MTEIKKFTKIAILIYGIVSLFFAVYVIFFLDVFLTIINMPTWGNPYHPRMFGGALLVVVIFMLLVLLKKNLDWEKIKLAYQVLSLWVPINLLVEGTLLAIYAPTLTPTAISQNILDLIIMSAILVLLLIAYIKQRS